MASEHTLSVEAFAEQFRRCAQALWGIAVAVLGNSARAEDAVQEAAMIALRKRHTFEPGTSFRAWMAKIVRFTALNHQRRAAKTGADGGDRALARLAVVPSPGLGISPRGQLEPGQQHFDDGLRSALAELGEDARACLLLRVVAELDYSEIGELLEMPEGTAMSHVHRARTRLRQLLGPQTDRVASEETSAR